MQQGLEEAVFRNIAAVQEMASITRSSFGPNGLNKLVVNQLNKLFMTADAGTILKELEIQHPAARVILQAAQQQDAEMGDGTNYVVLLSASLLERARDLLKMGLKPAVVSEGFLIGAAKVKEILEELAIAGAEDNLAKIVKTVLMAKQYGVENRLSELVLTACRMVGEDKRIDDQTERQQLVNPDNIRCVKILGGSLGDSLVVQGVVLNRLPESARKDWSDGRCKIAVYTCPVDIAQTETKGTVLFNTASEMLAFSRGEEDLIEERIRAIKEAGVRVIVTNEKFGEVALHFINKFDLIAVKVSSKFDIQRICKATGAPTLLNFVVPSNDDMCGWCDSLQVREFGSDRCLLIRNESARIASIILRGATLTVMNDYERAIDDAINVIRVLGKQDERCVAGAGACEAELARAMLDFAGNTPGLVQYPLRAISEAFEAIPGALAANAGYDRTDAVARLSAAHANGLNKNHGIAIDGNVKDPVVDALANGILDSFAVKQRAIGLAFEAAQTVLMVDQIIMSKPAGGPTPRAPQSQDPEN